MTYAEFIENLNGGARWDVGVSINRSNALPLDANSVFFSLADAESYVAGTLEGRLANAYPGQLLAVVTEDATTIHYIDINAEGKMSLQEVGAKIEAADASIEIVDGKITIGGFADAESLTLPQKQSDGTIKWVPISAIVEGDGNTVTEVVAADNTISAVPTQTSDEDGKVTNIKYDIKVNVSAEEGNAISTKEDGIYVATPEEYDDTQVKADIKAVSDLVGTTSVDSQIDAKIEALDLGNTYAEKEHTHEIEDVNGLQDALDAKQVAGDYATKTEAQGYADAKDEAITAAKKSGDDAQAYAEEVEGRVTDVEGRVTDVEDAIEVLNGDAATEGSVAKTVKDAINTFATEISDNGTYDTFKELVDYVTEHGGEAAEMASAITALEEKVGEKSVKVQIEEAIADENLDQYATDTEVSAIDGRLATVEGKVDVDKVSVAIAAALEEAKEYADNGDAELRGRIEALEEVDHEHENKDVIDGITAQNITDWNDAVAKEHEHENKDLLDTYTQTEEDLADAVSKKHNHGNLDVLNGISSDKITKWDSAEVNYINSVDTTELKVEDGKLSVVKIDSNKISGIKNAAESEITLLEALNSKVEKNGTDRLITEAEAAKLDLLVIDPTTGQAAISGTVNASQVQGLTDLLDKKVDKVDGMGLSANNFTDSLLTKLTNIEAGAQVNVIEGIKFNGVLLEIGEDKTVDIVHSIAIADSETLGVVKSSNAENGVSVANDGTMSVNSLNVNRLTQTEGEELIINCGAAAR